MKLNEFITQVNQAIAVNAKVSGCNVPVVYFKMSVYVDDDCIVQVNGASIKFSLEAWE